MPANNILDGRVVLDAIGGELVYRDLPTETDFSKLIWFPISPNGIVVAPMGSLCMTPLALYRNVDGIVLWTPIGGGGPVTAGATTYRTPFTFATASPLALGPALIAGNIVSATQIVIEVGFDDPAATLELGTNAAPISLNDDPENDPLSIGRYPGADRDRLAVGAEQAQLVITPGASTMGSGYVLYTISV
jgi:hypothetical protein